MTLRARAPRRQIVFERVHIRWELSDLPEYDDQVDVKANANQMQGTLDDGSYKNRQQNGIGGLCVEESPPSTIVACVLDEVALRDHGYVDVERDQTNVHSKGEDVVAGAAGRCTSFGRALKVINGI